MKYLIYILAFLGLIFVLNEVGLIFKPVENITLSQNNINFIDDSTNSENENITSPIRETFDNKPDKPDSTRIIIDDTTTLDTFQR